MSHDVERDPNQDFKEVVRERHKIEPEALRDLSFLFAVVIAQTAQLKVNPEVQHLEQLNIAISNLLLS